ncbi:MAG: divergent polysaccharide deacetylase family protein, partial [Tistlia sp.]
PAGGAVRPPRRGRRVLALAWLLLLLTVGAALAYAFLTYRPTIPEPTVTPAPRFEEAPVPPPELPDDVPQIGTGEGESPPSGTPPDEATEASPEAEPAPTTPETTTPETTTPEPPAVPSEPKAEAKPAEDEPPQSEPAEAGTGTPPAATEAPAPADEQQAALPRIQDPPLAPREPAWQRFAMPHPEATNRPRIAVVVTGLGLHDDLTQQAIELPAAITLSFSPYARGVETWLAQARAAGHEVMLDLPMEPQSYPNDDPGHFALFVANSSDQNLVRLREVLARGSAYVGVAAVMGSRFTAEAEALRPVLTALGDRGLIFLDNRESDTGIAGALGRELGVPTLYSDRTLDGEFVQANAIDARLAQVERLARTKGVAVALANVYPVTFSQLELWAEGLREKGLVLAPVTAVLGRQPPPE